MKNTIYAVESNKYTLLFNYLFANQDIFIVERVIPETSDYTSLVIDISEDNLIKAKNLLSKNLPSADLFNGKLLKEYPGFKILNEINHLIENSQICPCCGRKTSKPFTKKFIYDKEDPMYFNEISLCNCCKQLSVKAIHEMIDNPKDSIKLHYDYSILERKLLIKLYAD